MVNLTTRCPQWGRNTPAILTAAPFRGVPQPEAHGRRKFNDRLSMNQLPRRTLSRCVPAFNHVRRGGSCYSPTTRNSYNPDIPNNEKSTQRDSRTVSSYGCDKGDSWSR
ncbi:hypothetical protein FA806_18470 [Escherichia coli]|nr:hypothetical protein [Escherichia coli]